MAGFGGSVKLTGESEYKKALQQITQNLKEVSSQMKVVSSSYDKNDKSIGALTAKQDVLNKKLTEQKNKLSVLQSQYSSMASKFNENASAHAKLVDQYNKEKNELERIGKELGTSSKEYKDQKDKVNDLAQAVAKSAKEEELGAKAMSDMRVQMNNAQADINKTTKEIDNLGKETEETNKQVKSSSDGFTVLKGMIADLGSKAIQTAISGLKKLGGVVVNVGKQALDSYAEYEQLVGGVETLFQDSAKIVEGYANDAYKTAGLSANKYMETVTSFSASLLQGLNGDTAKTAKIADMAIIDMADNANKMGTSIEMIQNAYQGFAKQNYTMLDNLKLGYGGTKTEMVRLINDSKILNHEIKNLDGITFDQIVEAIHKVQENMGITGTTAKEASSTIQGSVASMKSAWQNLLTGIADDNQNFEQLVDNFIDSVITAGDNIVPRVKKIVEGVKKLIESLVTQVFPKLKKEIPELKPLIEVFEWFIKNKGTVVNAVKLIVGAFAVAKIAKFTKSLSDGAKSLIDWAKNAMLATTATTANTTAQVANTTAQVAGTATTGLLTKATALLNATLQANPIGFVIGAVMALIGAYSLLNKQTDTLTEADKARMEATKKMTEEVNNTTEAWKDLEEAQKQQLGAGMTELSHLQSLRNELKGIVDENGKVKEGYENRASFIVSTLSEALGIEIDQEKDLNEQIKQLSSNIDDVINKKKAQIILDSQEPAYTEAITKQTEATNKLREIEAQLNEHKKERSKLEDEIAEKQKKADEYFHSTGWKDDITLSEIANIRGKIQALDQETHALSVNKSIQEGTIQKYAYTVEQYETNMALAHEGRVNEMSTVDFEYVQKYGDTVDAKRSKMEDDIANTERHLEIVREMNEQSGTDMYADQVRRDEELLAEQKKALADYDNETLQGLQNVEFTWSEGLDSQLSQITGTKIEFKDAGNGTVQAYIDGVKVGEPKSKKEMAKLANEAINEVRNQKGEATTAGENIANGVGNGIDNKSGSVFSKIRSFGKNLLANLKSSLDERSPSKATQEMGQYLLEGLGLGIQKEEKGVIKQVTNLGKNILSTFDSTLNGETLGTNLSAQIKGSIPQSNAPVINSSSLRLAEDNKYNYNNMLEAFQEALASMKIELDDEEAGRFVRRTVENAIYT